MLSTFLRTLLRILDADGSQRHCWETCLRDIAERHVWEECLETVIQNPSPKITSERLKEWIVLRDCFERFSNVIIMMSSSSKIFGDFDQLNFIDSLKFNSMMRFFEDFYIIHYFNVFFENLTVRNSLCWFFEIDHFTCFQSYFSTWFFENITRILCENCLKISLRNCPKKSHFRREGWVSREIELIGSKLKITWSLQNVSILSLRACVKKHWTFTFFNYHLTIEPLKTIESSFFKNRLKRFFEEVLWR